MKEELKIFITAITFFTRIRIPFNFDYSEKYLTNAIKYFPFAGWLTGAISAVLLVFSSLYFPVEVAVVISMVGSIIFTGALHEDGFADFCDGFGNKFSKEKTLAVMKDSSNGTYAVLGLILILLAKFSLLSALPIKSGAILIVSGHVFSRLVPVFLVFTSKYARTDESAKSRPIGEKQHPLNLITACIFGFSGLIFLPLLTITAILTVSAIAFFIYKRYITRRIGGYTGDLLGALQQITEISVYFTFYLMQQI